MQRTSSVSVQVACSAVIAMVAAPSSPADVVTINPFKDNTLIEFIDGANSNALGSLFSGRSGGMGANRKHRAVLAFDFAAAIPAGSVINGVSLMIRLEQSSSGDQTHTLHRVLADWGEGTSQASGGLGAPATPGDATWVHRFFDTATWTAPGGDFVAAPSASAIIGSDNTVDTIFTGPQMVADVQHWIDDPCSGFGWIMLGNEVFTNTAKKFHSREAVDAPLRPRLMIDFTPPAVNTCPANIVDLKGAANIVNIDDLLAVISAWGPCSTACGVACDADIDPVPDGNGIVNIDDLLTVISAWGPCP